MSNNGAGAGLNPRDLAAAQLMAQQQAVYEAAMVGGMEKNSNGKLLCYY